MNYLLKQSLRCITVGSLTLAASTVQAHTGHGTASFFDGLAHPFGLDHLLAMVAVGIWSVSALPANKIWQGPAAFMLALVISASLGAMGVSVPFLEQLISLSLVAFGAMLVFSRQTLAIPAGLSLVTLIASLHGLAHGAEAPPSDFASYVTGFLATTAVLHFGGAAIGKSIHRHLTNTANWAISALGTLFGGAGLYLFTQL